MPGYLDLAREALAACPSKLERPEYEVNELNEQIPPWDQAEAERLLAQLREALARVDGAVAAGKAPAVRAAAMRTWLEVAERYVNGQEMEAARGWDALALLRAAVGRALTLASPGPAGLSLACARTAQDGPTGDMTAVTPPRDGEARRRLLACPAAIVAADRRGGP